MPVKKDGNRRYVEMERLLPGTPEQVWHAIATGEGNAAWFTRMELEPRAGGKLVVDFGDGATSTGEVLEWDAPRKFAYVERGWMPGAPDCFTEIHVIARDGGKCVMRMAHSLHTDSDEWDEHLESFESGWPGFFEVLQLYLERFRGLAASSFMARQQAKTEAVPSWKHLLEGLGLTGVHVGERRRLAGPEPVDAVVEILREDAVQRYVTVSIDGPAKGLLIVGNYTQGGVNTPGVARFVYGPDHERVAKQAKAAWKEWLVQRFAAAD